MVIKMDDNKKLVIVWSSGDREVALKMVFMYALNSKLNGWWDDITLIIWGPSSDLLSQDYELQEYLNRIKKAGIVVEACKACTDMSRVSDRLQQLGVDVKYIGEAFTAYIKEGRKIITF